MGLCKKYKLENKLVISPEDFYQFDKEKTYIFLATHYFSAIIPVLIQKGFKNVFKVTDLLEKINVSDLYEKIDLKFLYGKLQPLKLQRRIGFFKKISLRTGTCG